MYRESVAFRGRRVVEVRWALRTDASTRAGLAADVEMHQHGRREEEQGKKLTSFRTWAATRVFAG